MVRRRAPLAFALIALQLAAAVVGAQHLAVQHVVCPEHGELVDAPITPPTQVDDDDGYADDDNLAGRDHPRPIAHEHCAIAPADFDAIAPVAPIAIDVPAPIVTFVSFAPAAAPAHAIPPLIVAPKTSPPIRA